MDGAALCDVYPPPVLAGANERLLEVMRANPGATASALAAALGATKGSVVSRWRKLALRGRLEKDRLGHWRVAGDGPGPQRAPAQWTAEPEPGCGDRPFPPWVRPIGRFMRISTSEFACSRYG